MKILQINNFDYVRGGSDRVFLETAEMLSLNGHEVAIFSSLSKQTDEPINKQIKKYRTIDSLDIGRFNLKGIINFVYNFKAIKDLNDCIKTFKPEIIHLHIFQSRLSSFIIRLIYNLNIPMVMTVHEYKMLCPVYTHLDINGHICEQCGHKNYIPCISKKCLDNSLSKSFLMAFESYIRDYFSPYEKFISRFLMPSNFILQKHQLKFDKQKTKFIRQKYFIDHHKFNCHYVFGDYLIYFGRLSYVKGVLTLLKAAEYCKAIKILIVGTGPIELELIEFKKKYNIDNVEFLGYKNGQSLLTLISNSRGSIVPSEWFENFPLSIIESLAMGKPVIGANIGGIPEQVIDGKTGFIFDSCNPKELEMAIKKLWNLNENKHSKMSQFCKEFAISEYNKNEHYINLIGIYSDLINKNNQ
jgi:glycosyltransferase involved in cell wall biosynthesis